MDYIFPFTLFWGIYPNDHKISSLYFTWNSYYFFIYPTIRLYSFYLILSYAFTWLSFNFFLVSVIVATPTFLYLNSVSNSWVLAVIPLTVQVSIKNCSAIPEVLFLICSKLLSRIWGLCSLFVAYEYNFYMKELPAPCKTPNLKTMNFHFKVLIP